MSHLNLGISHQFLVFLRLTCLVTLFDLKLQVFKNSSKWTTFAIFNKLLSTQNVNGVRFARNVEWDFFCDFQTLLRTLTFFNSRNSTKKLKEAKDQKYEMKWKSYNTWKPSHAKCNYLVFLPKVLLKFVLNVNFCSPFVQLHLRQKYFKMRGNW